MDDKKYPFLISEREMKEWIMGCPAQVKKIRIEQPSPDAEFKLGGGRARELELELYFDEA